MTLHEIRRIMLAQFPGQRGTIGRDPDLQVVVIHLVADWWSRRRIETYLQDRVPVVVLCLPASWWQWLTCWKMRVVR
jgi:hypothetical protein